MISVEDALALVLQLAPKPVGEHVSLTEALGRALLEPAISRMTQPPFAASAMDGYAIRSADAAHPLAVIGESAAGHPFAGACPPRTAVRISTGAVVPDGYDRVVMQENVIREGEVVTVKDHSGGHNIRPAGDDFHAGDSLAPGRRLSPSDIALFAAMNVPVVTVARRPRVAILSGGDELVLPGTMPAPGQIISSNDLAIAALVRQAGADPIILPLARDTRDSLKAGFRAAENADLLITIGGASVGDHDLIGAVARDTGLQCAFHKVAMRPGKPLMAGRLDHMAMIGLPGNPVSAIVCGILFAQPLIMAMQGLSPVQQVWKARLGCDLGPEGNRQHYLRSCLDDGADLPVIQPFSNQDSARLSVMARADALLIRPANDPPRKTGEIVDFLRLHR